MANPIASKSRIDTVYKLLRATGWSDDGSGGLSAPEEIREAVAKQYGDGALNLWDAINAQVRFDCFVIDEAGGLFS